MAAMQPRSSTPALRWYRSIRGWSIAARSLSANASTKSAASARTPMPVEQVDMGGYTLIENASLATRNTLRVDARATLLAEIRDAAKLPELLDFPAIRNSRLLVLGEGSNMLFTGDFDGTVLAMATRGVQVESDGDSARIA